MDIDNLSGAVSSQIAVRPNAAKSLQVADAPEDRNDLYTDELQDLRSADDQIQQLLEKLGSKASDTILLAMLSKSQEYPVMACGTLARLVG